jgi:hypothetical protein
MVQMPPLTQGESGEAQLTTLSGVNNGRLGCVTVTVTIAVAVPPGPEAVKV